MARSNLIYFEDGHALITAIDELGHWQEFETLGLAEGRYVRCWDANCRDTWQLCHGASSMGNTVIYRTDEGLARACDARIFKTRAGYDRAQARLGQSHEDYILEMFQPLDLN